MKTKYTLLFFACSVLGAFAQEATKQKINSVLNAWHQAAADADFDTYFDLMTPDGVFIGTDALENWQNAEFRSYSKPHFDKGKAWSFTALERNVYLGPNEDFAWFDELLDTQMKLCRGSGVLKKIDGKWQIAHYVLSIAVPNENIGALIQLKSVKDSLVKASLLQKR